MEERVRDALRTAFPGAILDLGRIAGAERLGGIMAWEGFEDQEPMSRQEAIWAALREHLGDETSGISIILAYTPRELELMRAA